MANKIQQLQIVDTAGLPIPSASVILFPATKTFITDENGYADMRHYPLTESIEVSAVGFTNNKLSVKYIRNARVVLQKTAVDLDNVILESSYTTKTRMGAMSAGMIITCTTNSTMIIDTLQNIKARFTPSFKLYPNPAQPGQSFAIELKEAGTYRIRISDATGRQLLQQFFVVQRQSGRGQSAAGVAQKAPAAMVKRVFRRAPGVPVAVSSKVNCVSDKRPIRVRRSARLSALSLALA
jgi:hypothetical protein